MGHRLDPAVSFASSALPVTYPSSDNILDTSSRACQNTGVVRQIGQAPCLRITFVLSLLGYSCAVDPHSALTFGEHAEMQGDGCARMAPPIEIKDSSEDFELGIVHHNGAKIMLKTVVAGFANVEEQLGHRIIYDLFEKSSPQVDHRLGSIEILLSKGNPPEVLSVVTFGIEVITPGVFYRNARLQDNSLALIKLHPTLKIRANGIPSQAIVRSIGPVTKNVEEFVGRYYTAFFVSSLPFLKDEIVKRGESLEQLVLDSRASSPVAETVQQKSITVYDIQANPQMMNNFLDRCGDDLSNKAQKLYFWRTYPHGLRYELANPGRRTALYAEIVSSPGDGDFLQKARDKLKADSAFADTVQRMYTTMSTLVDINDPYAFIIHEDESGTPVRLGPNEAYLF